MGPGSGAGSGGQRDFGNSLGTGADHSRRGWVNQGNIHSLAAVLGANDLCHSFWSGLTQQLPCRRREKNVLQRCALKMGSLYKESTAWGWEQGQKGRGEAAKGLRTNVQPRTELPGRRLQHLHSPLRHVEKILVVMAGRPTLDKDSICHCSAHLPSNRLTPGIFI